MKQFRTIWSVLLLSILVIACEEKDGDDNNGNDNENNSEQLTISLGDIAEGEGSYALSGDVELSGSGNATYGYTSAATIDGTTWSEHTVEIEDVENSVSVAIDIFMEDSAATAFSGKAPETGTYKIYESGLETPTGDYAKVTVYGDGLASFFTTDGESQLDLTVNENGLWVASFDNQLDDYETDEEVTINCAFKATAE